MKRFLMITIALGVAITMGATDVQADGGQDGGWGPYTGAHFGGHGPGHRNFRGGNLNYWPAWNDFYNPYSFNRPETQPYFAMNPPVYYSDQIVPRPMGISPFPAPPGVLPIEMTVSPKSETVVNPYFQRKDQPVAGDSSKISGDDSDT